jgi:dTDP-4-amino-4,6-dideoxygalactose transaminase
MLPLSRPIQPAPDVLQAHMAAMAVSARYSNMGPCHDALRSALRTHLGAPHLALVANATLGLMLALRALKVGGEVITTPFTFAASAHAISWTGATPVFVDVEPGGENIDPAQVAAAISPRTEAILAVHAFGLPCDGVELERIASRHGLALVFDGAHAFDLRRRGEPIHRWGDATVYSAHATKLFHTAEGGMVVARSAGLAASIERLANFGFHAPGQAAEIGLNAKMSEVHAAVGLAVLPRVAEELAARLALRAAYERALAGMPELRLIAPPQDCTDTAQFLACRVADAQPADARDRLVEDLHAGGFDARAYFSPLSSEFPHYRARGGPVFPLAQAERASRRVLCLPFHSGVTAADVDAIAGIIGRRLSDRSQDGRP